MTTLMQKHTVEIMADKKVICLGLLKRHIELTTGKIIRLVMSIAPIKCIPNRILMANSTWAISINLFIFTSYSYF
jgi:hypothetical protein